MDCAWHLGAWIEVLSLPVPSEIGEADHDEYSRRLAEYIDRCSMVLEDWNQRDADWLGEFRWGWVAYEEQLAYLCLDVEGLTDLRLFLWVNDFAYGGERAIHVIAANADGESYLQADGIAALRRRREEVIAQLLGPQA